MTLQPISPTRVTYARIEEAAKQLQGHILRTPSLLAPRLSAMTDANIFLKYENLQATGSFKERGALIKLMSLQKEARERGVISISAGNHAQAVAYHAHKLGIPATIVMPENTPFTKVSNTEAFGANVVLSGDTVAEAWVVAEALQAKHQLTLVHPFDDPDVIIGQGTAGLELIEDVPYLDCVLVPIGGGGFISGVATAIKTVLPHIEVIGVEVLSYPSAYNAVKGQALAYGGPTLAEGIAVKSVGAHTLPLIRDWVSDIILVDEHAVEKAIFDFATIQKTIAEGASAAAFAAVVTNQKRFAKRSVGLFQCGGNIDPRVLSSILIRGLERDNKIISLRIAITDKPGMLGKIASELGRSGANILEVYHRRMYLDVPAKGAVVELVVETKDRKHAEGAIATLRSHGFDVTASNGFFGDPV